MKLKKLYHTFALVVEHVIVNDQPRYKIALVGAKNDESKFRREKLRNFCHFNFNPSLNTTSWEAFSGIDPNDPKLAAEAKEQRRRLFERGCVAADWDRNYRDHGHWYCALVMPREELFSIHRYKSAAQRLLHSLNCDERGHPVRTTLNDEAAIEKFWAIRSRRKQNLFTQKDYDSIVKLFNGCEFYVMSKDLSTMKFARSVDGKLEWAKDEAGRSHLACHCEIERCNSVYDMNYFRF